MKKVILLGTIVLILTIQPAFSVDLADYGITVQSKRTEDGATLFKAADALGQSFEILSLKEISSGQARSIVRIKDTLYSWRNMGIAQLRISLVEDRIEANVVPSSLSFGGTNFKPYLPSGMQFYIEEYIEYDFRMLVGNYVVKMRGQYFNEEQLLDKMQRAVENPIAYIQTTDPEYLFEQITALSEEMEQIRSYANQISQEAEDRWGEFLEMRRNYRALLNDHRTLKNDYAALRKDHDTFVERTEKAYRELDGKLNGLTEKHNALREEHDALATAHEELQSSHTELAGGVTTLQQAILMAANQNIFAVIVKTNVEGIKRYIALRGANPDMTRDEAVAAVKEEELNITGKEALLADMIYFADFDEKTK